MTRANVDRAVAVTLGTIALMALVGGMYAAHLTGVDDGRAELCAVVCGEHFEATRTPEPAACVCLTTVEQP